jgi:hypothetical protein
MVNETWVLYNQIMPGGKKKTKNINLAQDAQDRKEKSISEREIFSWEAKDFERASIDTKWYVVASVLIVALIGYSVWQRDWFVIGIIVVVSAVMFWYIFSVKPKNVSYKITPVGIHVDGRLYPFSEIHSFWMVYNDRVKSLYIAFTKKYLPTLVVGLENIDPVILKGFLLKKIPEQEKRGESLVDKFTRIARL